MLADKLNYNKIQEKSTGSDDVSESFCFSGGSPAADRPAENPPLLVPNGCKSATNAVLNRKRAKFLVRAFRGVDCGLSKGYRFRWFVLTESDAAIESGEDFSEAFHKLVTWLRKVYCPDVQYIVVEHRQGDGKRRNWHVLTYGSDKLPVREIRDYWLSHFKSTVTGMAEVVDIRKSVKYLAGYLSGEDKFVKSSCSQGWVFPGWIQSSVRYKRIYGEYIPSDILCELSWLPADLRLGELECLLQTGSLTFDGLDLPQAGPSVESKIKRLDGRWAWLGYGAEAKG